MTDQQTPPHDAIEAPPRPEGGRSTALAAGVAETGFGVDPDGGGVRFAGLRLAGLVLALVALGFANPWMLVVILALVVMITLHELGHFLTAKRAGMKVTEFFLGFGPKIWSTRRGETEYGIKLIPAGAYVKIIGMTNLEEVPPEDEGRTYRQKTFGQRVSVAVAGSTMHFLLAIALMFVALAVVGQPGGTMIPSESRPAVLDSVYAGSGAGDAGLREGDRIVEVDGRATPTWDDLVDTVGPLKGTTIDVAYERGGERIDTQVDLHEYTFTDDGTGDDIRACGLGVRVADVPEERVNPAVAAVRAPKEFAEVLGISVGALGRFFTPGGVSDFASQVGNAQDDKQEAREQREEADRKDEQASQDPCAAGAAASGPSAPSENRLLSIYGLVRIGSDVGEVDPSALISLFAMINIFIGVFNLVPLLPFDGGHVAIAAYEKVQEVRLKRRRYFIDVARLLPLTYAVVAVLGLIFVSSLYLDIANPLSAP